MILCKARLLLFCAVSCTLRAPAAVLLGCSVNSDCPDGARCLREECARCVCAAGSQLGKVFNPDGSTSHQCLRYVLRIGEECVASGESGWKCGYGAECQRQRKVCACSAGLVPRLEDGFHCRNARRGEKCSSNSTQGSHPVCNIASGLTCEGASDTCRCKPSFHRPSRWTSYIVTRWNYSSLGHEPRSCLPRLVGESCRFNSDCAAIASGAFCGPCGFCQCRYPEHVPDVTGTVCARGLPMGAACYPESRRFVCDGTLGLQCGDLCDLYKTSLLPRQLACRCSQMHDERKGACHPKRLGSPCLTDYDCYLLKGGVGFCSDGACARYQSGGHRIRHRPNRVSRLCPEGDATRQPPSTLAPPGSEEVAAGGREEEEDEVRLAEKEVKEVKEVKEEEKEEEEEGNGREEEKMSQSRHHVTTTSGFDLSYRVRPTDASGDPSAAAGHQSSRVNFIAIALSARLLCSCYLLIWF